jgi:hypothetical protein
VTDLKALEFGCRFAGQRFPIFYFEDTVLRHASQAVFKSVSGLGRGPRFFSLRSRIFRSSSR